MDVIKEINHKIIKLFETKTPYIIFKNSSLPRQTITELMTGKSDIKKLKSIQLKTIRIRINPPK
ncbi:hypothetical protein BU121_00640 [Staphylococcus xylosus]|nr:hypothetical protein [Staphylococcus xylosus]MCQ3815417.1 hypothetical protein [Staphylococcus xylosus]MCQ3818120.1 hypothetical protein [Staphylococcus xylosus]OEK80604.1 hypothetical protein AST16_02630 [Staphylococcus xylosus]OEK85453.1 hypothetical protein AST17_10140 [Staphylococcus xylosus]